MSRPSKGSRLKLLGFDQELIDDLQDFREAYLDASEGTILAEAVRAFIKDQLQKNQDVARRYRSIRERQQRQS